jgi:hypothetical protein
MRMLAWPVPVIRTDPTLPDGGARELRGSPGKNDLCS